VSDWSVLGNAAGVIACSAMIVAIAAFFMLASHAGKRAPT
jgi:hypothetical protein